MDIFSSRLQPYDSCKKTATLLLYHSIPPSEYLAPVLRVWLPLLPSWTFFLRSYSHQPYIYTPTTSYPLSKPITTHHISPLLPDWLVHSILSIGPHSYINKRSLPPGIILPKTLKMGQTSVPEMLVTHQRLTPGYNPNTFKQHYDHGGSLQLHTYYLSLQY
jgi:hypothetical protein